MQHLASQTLGKLQRRRRHTIVAGCFLLAATLFAIKPVYENTYYDVFLEITGAIFILCGFAVRLWCTLYIGGRKNRDLLSDGPYSLCRNPLYVGSILAAFGIGLQTEMLSFGILCGVGCWAIFHVVVSREERYLLGEFGEPYRRYLETTPRFVPRFSAYKDDLREHSFRPAMLWNTFRDGLVLFAAIPVTEVIEVAHGKGLIKAVWLLY